MAHTPDELRYTKDHEWARLEDDEVIIGITDHAQESLGDVVYVDLPELGDSVSEGEPFGTVESTKAVSELFAPVDGEVLEVNEALADSPETVNDDPYGDAWMIRVKPSDPKAFSRLMDAGEYASLIENER